MLDPLVFGAQKGSRFRVKYLEGDHSGLPQDISAELGIGKRLDVLSFINEALSIAVDDHRKGIRITNGTYRLCLHHWRIFADNRGMASSPVAGGLGTDIKGRLQSVADIIPRSTKLYKIPVFTQITSPHLRVCLKASTAQDHVFCIDLNESFRTLSNDSAHLPLRVDDK